MNRLYRRLAFTNIRNSRQFYLPYLLTGILSAMLFYCMRAMQGNEGLAQMHGGMEIKSILTFGLGIVAIFIGIFLFYTNSFIMKRRKKELGVYNILGMEKKHIAKVMFWETLFTFAVSVGGGLGLGIAFQKLLTMLLYHLTGLESSIQFYVSGHGCLQTIQLFAVIYLLGLLYNFMQIQMANPIELLRSQNAGEKEPKTKLLMTAAGVLCIGMGYYIAITTENPMAVLSLFFVAVLLVILGTYFLFTAGSIAFLKLLRKNRSYYYQTKHFTTVSGMIYRMKQNAVGLANICILSTMVLVMISTTVSMYVGLDDELENRYPAEIGINIYYHAVPEAAATAKILETVKGSIQDSGRTVTGVSESVSISVMGLQEGNELSVVGTSMMQYMDNSDINSIAAVGITTKEWYEGYAGTSVKDLQNGEVAIASEPEYTENSIILNQIEYRVAEFCPIPEDAAEYNNIVGGTMYLIVKDDAALQQIYQNLSMGLTESDRNIQIIYSLNVDIDGTKQEKLDCVAAVRETLQNAGENGMLQEMGNYDSTYIESREEGYESFLSLNGGLFFLGLFLGVMFLMVTVLIIYYKQISEGYEDKERFAIMEKVGMSNMEVKKAIGSQIRTVFFLPLVTAAIHLAAAFPMLKRLLAMLNLTNGTLFILCLIGTVIVFGLIYLVVFILTSKSYYKIVGNQV